MKIDKEYCVWQKDIFAIMNKKGYSLNGVAGTCIHPIIYDFVKEKKIGDNRYRRYFLRIIVDNNNDSNWFSANYRCDLKDYSRNSRGYIDGYWGRTPWVTAKTFFWKNSKDMKNFIKDIKFGHPY